MWEGNYEPQDLFPRWGKECVAVLQDCPFSGPPKELTETTMRDDMIQELRFFHDRTSLDVHQVRLAIEYA